MPQTVYGKVIRPKEFNLSAFMRSLESVMHMTADVIDADFAKTTQTWKVRPDFQKIVKTTGLVWSAEVFTENEIYGYVNYGTDPHEIWAGAYTGKSDKTRLFFASQFTPKTQAGIIGSNPGFVGERDTLTPMVHHPGNEGRFFDKAIKKKREKPFADDVSRAMYDAGFRSGHGVR